MGGGVAPWNVQQYELFEKEGRLFGRAKESARTFEVIFYHFQALKLYRHGEVDMGGYRLPKKARKLIYEPYVRHLERARGNVARVDASLSALDEARLAAGQWRNLLRYVKHRLMGNVVPRGAFVEDNFYLPLNQVETGTE
jgi:hypothetical protein